MYTGPRYTVEPARRWINSQTGQRASIFGACPWYCAADRKNWNMQEIGFTLRDHLNNTTGNGRAPFTCAIHAQAYADKLNGKP